MEFPNGYCFYLNAYTMFSQNIINIKVYNTIKSKAETARHSTHGIRVAKTTQQLSHAFIIRICFTEALDDVWSYKTTKKSISIWRQLNLF